MGLRDNFYQAIRELLGGGKTDGSDSNEHKSGSDYDESSAKGKSDVSGKEFGDFMDRHDEEKNADEGAEIKNHDESVYGKAKSEPGGIFSRPNLFGKPVTPSRPSFAGQPGGGTWSDYFKETDPVSRRTDEETTVISKSTVVVGSIRSLANVTIEGKVSGNVDVLKDATLKGVLVGDLMCNNSNMRGSTMQGDVLSKGNVYIDNDSMLLGDLKAQYSSVDGKVKGNMDIGGKIQIHQNAIVAGNINAGSIMVEDGANIRGFVNTTFLSEHADTAFPSQVEIGNDESPDIQ